mmetsp:Transcript_35523/g.81303  ORF Transcript_35523/g.81303 Transcript_35523/m.81303 type:complete len:97 (+) Transcript_35523:513-803(+)
MEQLILLARYHLVLNPSTDAFSATESACTQEAESYANDNGIFFMETSAKTAANVNELFVAIARKLPKNSPQARPGGGQGLVNVTQGAPPAEKKGCC